MSNNTISADSIGAVNFVASRPPVDLKENSVCISLTIGRFSLSRRVQSDAITVDADKENNFSAFVIGPDATGETEACEVAYGSDWELAAP